jgi:hypothetical protein
MRRPVRVKSVLSGFGLSWGGSPRSTTRSSVPPGRSNQRACPLASIPPVQIAIERSRIMTVLKSPLPQL